MACRRSGVQFSLAPLIGTLLSCRRSVTKVPSLSGGGTFCVPATDVPHVPVCRTTPAPVAPQQRVGGPVRRDPSAGRWLPRGSGPVRRLRGLRSRTRARLRSHAHRRARHRAAGGRRGRRRSACGGHPARRLIGGASFGTLFLNRLESIGARRPYTSAEAFSVCVWASAPAAATGAVSGLVLRRR